jgi:putative endonuclease
MYYVYILFSDFDKQLYIGFTPDLKSRFSAHEHGYVRSTKHRRPLRLIYYKAYIKESDTKQREKYLKSGKGRGESKVQLRHVLADVHYNYL